jgi:hypothetical protein
MSVFVNVVQILAMQWFGPEHTRKTPNWLSRFHSKSLQCMPIYRSELFIHKGIPTWCRWQLHHFGSHGNIPRWSVQCRFLTRLDSIQRTHNTIYRRRIRDNDDGPRQIPEAREVVSPKHAIDVISSPTGAMVIVMWFALKHSYAPNVEQRCNQKRRGSSHIIISCQIYKPRQFGPFGNVFRCNRINERRTQKFEKIQIPANTGKHPKLDSLESVLERRRK